MDSFGLQLTRPPPVHEVNEVETDECMPGPAQTQDRWLAANLQLMIAL